MNLAQTPSWNPNQKEATVEWVVVSSWRIEASVVDWEEDFGKVDTDVI